MGALLSLCDGLIWSELGTAYPEAGGSYAYLKHLYGEKTFGRAFSFLYAWQLLISAPLSIASGCIGFSQYFSFFFPNAHSSFCGRVAAWCSCGLERPDADRDGRLLASRWSSCIAASSPSIASFAGLGLAVGLTLVLIIVAGFTHFNAHRAFDFPAGAFHLNGAFFVGLGAGMLISAYDYWGYYNVCFLGAEVRDPQRTIPRAVLGAIGIVGTLYLLMNVSVLGVLAVARDGAEYRQPRANVHDGRVHGAALRAHGSGDDCGADCARSACLRLCATPARIFANPLRRSARWQFPSVVRTYCIRNIKSQCTRF